MGLSKCGCAFLCIQVHSRRTLVIIQCYDRFSEKHKLKSLVISVLAQPVHYLARTTYENYFTHVPLILPYNILHVLTQSWLIMLDS